ncbi:MAG: MraY family glycosyltransferase [Nitrospiraceae bacterium]|nr:MraY family glycosyltransferase [Nitrospiraceae bacterium]
MTVKVLYYFISYASVAFIIALALTPLMRPLSFRLGAVDKGTGRRVHTGTVPRLGGGAIFLAFMLPVVFSLTRGQWDLFHDRMVGILVASALVFCIGVYDDLKVATVNNKLIAEVLVAVIIYLWGIRITVLSNPLGPAIQLGWWGLPVTVLWIVIVTNAVNLIDGLDGLAAGTGILISLALLAVSGDTHMQLVYVVLAGSLAGFLVYNFPPASIFMGDAGSLFTGFFLGAISIISSHKATAMATIMIPVIAFSFPLMDMAYAVLRRYYRGVPLGEADREHIHHKLLEKGLSKKKVLFLLYFINGGLLLAVLILVRRQLNVDFLGLILIVVVAVLGLRLFGYIEFQPFLRDTLRNYEIGRKRKYFNYIIKRFRRNAKKCGSLDELKPHLSELMREYNFRKVNIFFYPAHLADPLYSYISDSGHEPEKPLFLSFPVVGGNGYTGSVNISKETDDDYFLCTAELVRAVSEEVGRFL